MPSCTEGQGIDWHSFVAIPWTAGAILDGPAQRSLQRSAKHEAAPSPRGLTSVSVELSHPAELSSGVVCSAEARGEGHAKSSVILAVLFRGLAVGSPYFITYMLVI